MKYRVDIKSKKYGDQLIFEDTSFEILEKSFVAIKGPSGSGKSTILRILGMLEEFDGDYFIDEELIDKKKLERFRKKYITYIFQSSRLIPYENAYDNIIMPLKNLKEKIDKEEILNIAKKLKIDNILNKKVESLCGWEQQSVSIARAVATKRSIILADEPTGSLDSDNVIKVMNLFKMINQEFERTIIMVTHDNHLDDYFDKIYNIEEYKIKWFILWELRKIMFG